MSEWKDTTGRTGKIVAATNGCGMMGTTSSIAIDGRREVVFSYLGRPQYEGPYQACESRLREMGFTQEPA